MCIDDIFYEENTINTAIAGSFEKVISLLGEIVVPVWDGGLHVCCVMLQKGSARC